MSHNNCLAGDKNHYHVTNSSTHANIQVPWVPLVPSMSMFMNISMMVKLNHLTWIRLGVWMTLGWWSRGICPLDREIIQARVRRFTVVTVATVLLPVNRDTSNRYITNYMF